MIKFVLQAAGLLAFVIFVCGDDFSEVLERIKSTHLRGSLSRSELNNKLSDLEEACPGVTQKLKQAIVSDTQECERLVGDSSTVCDRIQKYAKNCTRSVLKVADDCLPEHSKGLPVLLANIIASVFKYACAQSGESLFEFLNPCLYQDSERPSPEFRDYEQKIQTFIHKHRTAVPSPNDVCQFVDVTKSYAKIHVRTACRNSKTRDVVSGWFAAAEQSCIHLNRL